MPEAIESPGPVCVRCGEPGAWRKLENGWRMHGSCHIIWLCLAAELRIHPSAVPIWLATDDAGKESCEKWAAI